MGYQVVRTQKLKSTIAVNRSLDHAFRAVDTPNADPDRIADNTHIGADSVDVALKNFQDRLDTQKTIRKNGVLAIEYLITASPEAMNGKTRAEQDAYLQDGLAYLKDKHGAENVIYAGIHRDESTPHLYAFVVPIDAKGKLNCRSFLGGAKALSELQTDFHKKVSQHHGLDRGIEGSKARHTKIKDFYSEVNQTLEPLPEVKTPEPKLRREPEKPGLFAGLEERSNYKDDIARWEKSQAKAEEQNKQRKAELRARRVAAVEMVERYQAQAAQAKVLKKEMVEVKKSNSFFSKKLKEVTALVAKLQEIVNLFTPAEIQKARERKARLDAEKAHQAELARSKAEADAKEAARLASIEAEAAQRVERLHKLSGRGGAEHTFGIQAATAIREAGYDASLVNWKEVEDKTIRIAIEQKGQKAESVTAVILKNSPLRADPATHAEVVALVAKVGPQLEAQYQHDRAQRSGKGQRLGL